MYTRNYEHMLKRIVWNRTVFTYNCIFVLDRNKQNHLVVWKKMSAGSFKNIDHISNMY